MSIVALTVMLGLIIGGPATALESADLSRAIPFEQLGQQAMASLKGHTTGIEKTPGGALLKSDSQKLNARAGSDGLWLESTEQGAPGMLRLKAESVGRVSLGGYHHFETNGHLISDSEVASFIRPGIVEEYRASVDGVRQDFILAERPSGLGELVLSLALSGAEARETACGVKMIMEKGGRELAYSRLQVSDATGKAIPATLTVGDVSTILIKLDDSNVTYPLRIDPTFSDADWIVMNPTYPGTNGTVRVIKSDNFGNIYVGGEFTFAGDIAANRIAKWNGTNWTALGTGLNNSVYAIEIDADGNVYAGGTFTTAGGANANRVAKWNGSTWTALGAGANGFVSSLESDSSGNLYAGGDFTVAGSISANRIAKWNGSTWSALGSGISGSVNSIAVSADGNLYAGGSFLSAGGVGANFIARWNGSAWFAMGAGMDNIVYAVAADSNGTVYAGGDFNNAGGLVATRIAKWNGVAWSRLSTTSSGVSFTVRAVAVDASNRVYIGGYQTGGGGPVRVWDGNFLGNLGTTPSIVCAIGIDHFGKIYVGGSFDSSVYPTAASNIGTYENFQFVGLHSQLIYGGISAVATDSLDQIYVAGNLKYSGDIPGNYIARWDGATWSHVGDRLFSYVNSMVVDHLDNLYVCDTSSCCKWDGNTWTELGSFNTSAGAIVVDAVGNLYVGGGFTTAGGVQARGIAKWSNGVWSPLGTGLNGAVSALALDENGNLFAGGSFTAAGDLPVNMIAKWNGNQWATVGSGFSPYQQVSSLAFDTDGNLYAGGQVILVNGSNFHGVACWNGANWSPVGWTTNEVRTLVADGYGNLFVGGDFYAVGQVDGSGLLPATLASNIAKWNGRDWSALGSGMSGPVTELALDFSGRLYAGGAFNTAGGKVSRFVAKAVNLLDELPPFFTLQPSDLSILEGDSAVLSSRASGIPPFSWQWYRGQSGDTSQPVGTDSKNLATPPLLTDTSFWVRVTNPFGSTDSQTATVTTAPRFPIFSSPASYTGNSGELFSAQAQATLGPLTFSATNLPDGLSLDSATGWITGTPTTPGSWTAQVTAANYLRASTTAITFTIVPPKPVITSVDAASGRVNDPFSHQLAATQSPTTYGAGNLPSGLSLNPSTGLISGAPTAYGTFVVAVTAVNDGGTGQQTLNLFIAPPIPPPVITSPLFAAATANQLFSFQLTASNTPQTFAIQSGPVWLSVDASTGLLSGMPILPGTATVQVRATNTTGLGAWSLLSISISPHPDAPVVTSLAEARGRKNDAFSFQLTASPAATTYAISGPLPAGITLVPASGLLSGTPSVEGTFNVTVTASNASGQSIATPFRIVLGPPRQVPVINSAASFTANVGAAFSTNVLATNSPTSFTFENIPAALVQSGTTGQISGILNTPGNFTFTVKATNADGTGPIQSMVLNVQYDPNAPNVLAYSGSSNDLLSASSVAAMPNSLDFPGSTPLVPISPTLIIAPPAATPPGPSGYVGVPFSFQVLVDKQATLFTATVLPAGLTIAPATGMIGGTPTASGCFEVTLQASNASGIGAPRVMTFSIAPKPDTPEIVGSLQEETYALSAFSYKIQTSSILPVTSYSVTGLPDGLSANYSTGQISGAATVTGLFEVKLRASSAVGVGAEKILYLLVRAGPLVPKITSSASVSVQQGFSLAYQISATNSPIQGYQASGLPDGLALNATTGLISGKPVVPGIYQVILYASNVNGVSDPLTLQIQVKPNPAVPVMQVPSYYYYYSGQPFELELRATGLPSTKPWSAGIGIFAESLPAGMSLNSATGILSGFPVQSQEWESRTIRFFAVNETGLGASASVNFQTRSLTASRPVLLSPRQLDATAGQTLNFTIKADRVATPYEFLYFTDGASSSGSIQQKADFVVAAPQLPGRYSYHIAANSGNWGVLSGLPLTVAPAPGTPAIQTPSEIYVTAGSPISAALTASLSPTRFEITAMSPAWPSGLNFQASTGAFFGTVARSGVISFLARAYNTTGASLPKEITMVFSPPSGAPAIVSGGSQLLSFGTRLLLANGESSLAQTRVMALTPPPLSGKVGEAFSHQFQASGNVIRFGVTGLPAGLVYNENTGEVSGEPTKPGLFDLVVTPIGATVSGQPVIVSLQIDPADGTPEMTSAPSAPAIAGTAFTWQFTANGNPSGYNLAKLPDWLVFNPFTGSLSGTPERPGETMLKISAFNALGQGKDQEFTIESAAAAGTPVMDPPVGNLTGQVGAAFSASISGAGTVSFYDATALPFGISLDSQTGIFSGTPVEPGTHIVQVWGVNAQGTGESMAVTFAITPATGTPLFVGETVLRLIEGQPLEHAFATVPTATAFADEGLPTGWTFNSVTGLLQGTPLSGTYNLALEAWNGVGSSGRKVFQIRVFANPSDLWNDEKFGEQAGDSEISGWDADPDHDGVVNLLERAFNLNPTQPGRPTLIGDTGTAGLPLIRRNGEPPVFSIQYLRRKPSTNPGLDYVPQFSSSLNEADWAAAIGVETVESIDTEWERVTVTDSIASPPTARFGRVKVIGVTP